MFSVFKVVVALLVVVAVATVLISPDPTDDVTGILHQHIKLQKLAAILAQPVSVPSLGLVVVLHAARSTVRLPDDIVSLTCVRLC